MSECFVLWLRAETVEEAEAQGKAWADAEPRWSFVGVLSVVPHAEFYGVWYVTVACEPVDAETLTLWQSAAGPHPLLGTEAR